ncbi:hypothetical protein GALMADRAFT_209494 [Galerina marginata CBS 339.88]|uniref:Uncharacterized protein n=1 Tax=Galerina marginata (strain CBS 339.88) TaxID=685588 RepID=A0A067TDR2_GALM3|nr:hypothetical protein GALMADRAFT_209494 [Galerina marginata CBS 339.88]
MSDFQLEAAIYDLEEQFRQREESLASREDVLNMNERERDRIAGEKPKRDQQNARQSAKRPMTAPNDSTVTFVPPNSLAASSIPGEPQASRSREAIIDGPESVAAVTDCVAGIQGEDANHRTSMDVDVNQKLHRPVLSEKGQTATTLVTDDGARFETGSTLVDGVDYEMECHVLQGKVALLEKVIEDQKSRKELVDAHLFQTNNSVLALYMKLEQKEGELQIERRLHAMREEATSDDLVSATLRVKTLENDKQKLQQRLQERDQVILKRDQDFRRALDDLKGEFSEQIEILHREVAQTISKGRFLPGRAAESHRKPENTSAPPQPINPFCLTEETLDHLATDMGDWYFTIRNTVDRSSLDRPSTSEAQLRKTMENMKRWRIGLFELTQK